MSKAAIPTTSRGDPVRRQAVIYARVSSKEQEKEGFSIGAQLKLLREYSVTQGFRVAQEYVDVETAKQTGRSAFGEMVSLLRRKASAKTVSSASSKSPERLPGSCERSTRRPRNPPDRRFLPSPYRVTDAATRNRRERSSRRMTATPWIPSWRNRNARRRATTPRPRSRDHRLRQRGSLPEC